MEKTELIGIIGEASINPKDDAGRSVTPRPAVMGFAAILCSEDGRATGGYIFAVVDMGPSGVAAVWEKHVHTAEDVEALRAAKVLNKHEDTLLAYGIGKG